MAENVNIKKAYNYMINNLGYSDVIARALIGNFMQESNLDPNAKNSIGATGVAQWLGPRLKELKKQPNWKTLEGQLDFMHKEFQTTEKKAWNAISKAKNISEATIAVSENYERPGKEEANNENRIKQAHFDNGSPDVLAIRNRIKNEMISSRLLEGQEAKDFKFTDENLIQELDDKVRSEVKSIEDARKINKSSLDAINEKEVKDKIDKEKIDTDTANQSVKDGLAQTEFDKRNKSFDEKTSKFLDSFKESNQTSQGFTYDKKDFKKQLPLDAIGQGALGLIGLAQADNELPLREEEVSAATLAYLEEVKRISKQGLPPDMEAKAKRDLTDSTKVGIDNITRASGGNRNLILANIGGLDANKAKAITNLNIANQEAKDKAFEEYGKTLQYIDDFNKNRDAVNHSIKLDEAKQDRAAGQALANSGFSSMLNELQYQRENGPGSANDQFRKMMEFEMFGQVHGVEDRGQPGSKSYKLKEDANINALNEKDSRTIASQEHSSSLLRSLTPEEKNILELSNINLDTVDFGAFENKEDLINSVSQAKADITPPAGYNPVNNPRAIDGDTYKENGVSNRQTLANGGFFDALEKGQPGSTGRNVIDAFPKGEFFSKQFGTDLHGRNLSNLLLKTNDRFYDTGLLQSEFDQVDYLDDKFGTPTLDALKAQNRNPLIAQEPRLYRNQ